MSDDKVINLGFGNMPNDRAYLGGLVFGKLTGEDWQVIFDNGIRDEYMRNELILQQGQQNETLYFISDGEVRIERKEGGKILEMARLGIASVFGEMSFLEKSEVSADVVADCHVVILKADGPTIEKLIERDPEFGLRFYHSIAVSLSRRLRATNALV
ncbi:MAG: cyclic nucleotide-binding domain-containing protein [Rhodospirillales bacterium]|nr:cyclic nucleotide-binding domain-containing protein [Rhodospirillales bacterium]